MKIVTLVFAASLVLGCGASKKAPTEKKKAPPEQKKAPPEQKKAPTADKTGSGLQLDTPEALARVLVTAIHKNDAAAAFKLLPTPDDIKQLGMSRFASPKSYERFLAKRRRGFDRVVAKFKRKYPAGCKKLVFTRLVKNGTKRWKNVDTISSIDLFAKCDGQEIWLADPDMLIKLSSGWKLLEFS